MTATNIDSNENISSRLPYLIGGVIALSTLLLFAAFRSIVIPLTAAAMNLLSVAAAYGVMAYVLEGGWAGQLLGIDTETPMPGFVPVMVFAVLFGLSMDYEVFLISRMREAWTRTSDNARAVRDGLAGTGRVITAAAAIMIAVFAAFVPSPDIILKVIGLGMATAILIDATVVRMLLVPAVMCWVAPTGGCRSRSRAGCRSCTSRAVRNSSCRPRRTRWPTSRTATGSAHRPRDPERSSPPVVNGCRARRTGVSRPPADSPGDSGRSHATAAASEGSRCRVLVAAGHEVELLAPANCARSE